MMRRRVLVPQQTIEDLLGCFRYGEANRLTMAELQRHMGSKGELLKRALRSMESQELLEINGNQLTLTPSGQHEAQRLLRAHRLWESYLEHVGTPSEQLHARADELEHVHDEATVDYLDDKLGHPLRDPHGALIPEDFIHLVPGAEVKASLLREGHRATITALDRGLDHMGLDVGMEIKAGPRSNDGAVWTFELPDRSLVRLDHDSADGITVRLQETRDSSA
jgi:manganese/iron transport system permease protein/iron/zinc/copper transport system permease protein